MKLTAKKKKKIGDALLDFMHRTFPQLTHDQIKKMFANLYYRFRKEDKLDT